MQVQNSLINSVAKTYNRNTNAATEPAQAAPRKAEGRPRTDSVAFSSTFQDVMRARIATDSQPEVRADRVAALKAAIQGGTYRIDSEALAAKLLGW